MPAGPISAHRAAYVAAYGPLEEGVVVRHKCDNPACCNPLHLETGTHADNVRDRVLRDRSAKGSRNGRAKVTESIVRQIRAGQTPAREWAERLGMTAQQVNNIRKGRSWTHVPN